MNLWYLLRISTLGIVLIICAGVFYPVQAQQPDHEAQLAAAEVLAMLNEWRIEMGLSPFAVNKTLTQMAQDQVDYLISLPELPLNSDDLYLDRQGMSLRERAASAPYSWSGYSAGDEQIIIGEIAALGSPAYAIDYWQKSSVDRETVTNPAYREIGIGAASHRFGYLFIVVMGAQPNTIPALVNASHDTLYLFNERYAGGDVVWIRDVNRIQLFDSAGHPLYVDWQPWSALLPVPDGITGRLFVLYSGSTVQVLTEVDFATDIIILPETLGALPSEQIVALMAGGDSAGITTPLTVTPAQPAAQQPQPTVESIPTQSPPTVSNEAAPTLIPTSMASTPRQTVMIVYDDRTLSIVNNSKVRVNLEGLSISGGGVVLETARWSDITNVLLDQFLQTGCLQVWAWSEPTVLPQPDGCQYRQAYLFLDPTQVFWSVSDFQVQKNGVVLATCRVGVGRCEVVLP